MSGVVVVILSFQMLQTLIVGNVTKGVSPDVTVNVQ